MMEFLANNWYMILIGAIIIVAVVILVIKWFQKPNAEKIENLKEWLKLAVARAEKEYGSGTGVIKLRAVYDWAIEKFPWVAIFVTFETFSEWVDMSLDWLNNAMSENEKVNDFIKK